MEDTLRKKKLTKKENMEYRAIMHPICFSINKNKFTLTCLSTKDIKPLYQLTIKEKELLKETLPWLDTINKEEDTRQYILESINMMDNLCAIRMDIKVSGTIIGILSLDSLNVDYPRIRYWIAKKYEGYGIMYTALSSFIKKLHQNLVLSVYVFI